MTLGDEFPIIFHLFNDYLSNIAEDVAQLVACFPGMLKALGWIPRTT